MTLSASITRSPLRQIAARTRGNSHGPITRLMSPSDLGQLLKPFVSLISSTTRESVQRLWAPPHSGIATLTYVAEGSVSFEDTNGGTGLLQAGGVEWMQAGGGVWHGGGAGEPGGRAASSCGSPCAQARARRFREPLPGSEPLNMTAPRACSSAATGPRRVPSKPRRQSTTSLCD